MLARIAALPRLILPGGRVIAAAGQVAGATEAGRAPERPDLCRTGVDPAVLAMIRRG